MILAPAQPDEMIERHRGAARSSRPVASRTPALARNVDAALSIGDITFFQFRGRAYGVPPLPWRAGQRLLDARMRITAALDRLTRNGSDEEARRQYYSALAEIPPLLWANTRPVGLLFVRLRKRLGLYRNPFDDASDDELIAHADFFGSRRMKAGVRSWHPSGPRRRPMSSTT